MPGLEFERCQTCNAAGRKAGDRAGLHPGVAAGILHRCAEVISHIDHTHVSLGAVGFCFCVNRHYNLSNPVRSRCRLQTFQIASVQRFIKLCGMAQNGFLVDIAAAVCDFFGAGNIASGRILYTLDLLRGVKQAVRRAGIEPDKITVELDYMQLFAAHILQVDVRNLKLTACGRLQIARNLYDTVVIEVQTRNNIVRLRIARLLLDGDGAALCIELNHAERTPDHPHNSRIRRRPHGAEEPA